MKRILFFTGFLLFVYSYVHGDDCEFHIGIHINGGVVAHYCSSYDSVIKTPEWDGYSDNPPLKLSEAITIGRKWLKRTSPKLSGLQIKEISISRLEYDSDIKNRWFYTLSFQAAGTDHIVKILMDGSVIEPKSVPPK